MGQDVLIKEKYPYIIPPCAYDSTMAYNMSPVIPFNIDFEINGDINTYLAPMVKIEILNENMSFHAILDTGAYGNYITQWAELELKSDPIDTGFSASAQDAIPDANIYLFEFKFNGLDHIFSEEFKVMPGSYPTAIILGAHFINQCKSLSLDSRTGTFKLVI